MKFTHFVPGRYQNNTALISNISLDVHPCCLRALSIKSEMCLLMKKHNIRNIYFNSKVTPRGSEDRELSYVKCQAVAYI